MKKVPKQKPGRSKQDVRTPQDFLDAVRRRLGIQAFAIDGAADATNTVATRFYDKAQDSLKQSWVVKGWGWLNPEFGDIRPWVWKAYTEGLKGASTAMLVPAGVGSNWWRDFTHHKAGVLLLNGRITFVGHEDPYPKDCALLLYGPNVLRGYDVWTWPEQKGMGQPGGGLVSRRS